MHEFEECGYVNYEDYDAKDIFLYLVKNKNPLMRESAKLILLHFDAIYVKYGNNYGIFDDIVRIIVVGREDEVRDLILNL
jgi:VanZ family protein